MLLLRISTLRRRAARLRLLNRRTRDGAVGTEHAAVARLRAQQRAAAWAVEKENACVRWHRLCLGASAVRTGQRTFQIDRRFSHRLASQGLSRGSTNAKVAPSANASTAN